MVAKATVFAFERGDDIPQEVIHLFRCPTDITGCIERVVQVDCGKGRIVLEPRDQVIGTTVLLDLGRGGVTVLADAFVQVLAIPTGGQRRP